MRAVPSQVRQGLASPHQVCWSGERSFEPRRDLSGRGEIQRDLSRCIEIYLPAPSRGEINHHLSSRASANYGDLKRMMSSQVVATGSPYAADAATFCFTFMIHAGVSCADHAAASTGCSTKQW